MLRVNRLHAGIATRAIARIIALASGLCLLLPTPASALNDFLPTTVVPVANAPIALSNCKLMIHSGPGVNAMYGSVNVLNRDSAYLESAVVRWTLYNHGGEHMGQGNYEYKFGDHVAGGEVATTTSGFDVSRNDSVEAIGRVTCRIDSAKWEGNRTWKFGRAWSGKLLPVPSAPAGREYDDRAMNAGSALSEPTPKRRTHALVLPSANANDFTILTTNAWNDTVDGNMLVHVALDVQGGNHDGTLTPQSISLIMALANGGKKAYTAIPVGAPTFQKINPIGNTPTIAYEVDPKEDLGRIGSLIVPAHGTAKIVATFLIGRDVVANATDNWNVVLK